MQNYTVHESLISYASLTPLRISHFSATWLYFDDWLQFPVYLSERLVKQRP